MADEALNDNLLEDYKARGLEPDDIRDAGDQGKNA
jgi:hypothetical protein